jgi:putative molybdopterin biosynthesis protein
MIAETELYTPQEVAKLVRVKRTTIYQHIKKGQLKAIRIGKQYRITKAQLEEYLQQNVEQGVSPENRRRAPTEGAYLHN